MKKYLFFLILGLSSFLTVSAQKENGIVYSEHEAINKTRAMWDAFAKGDKESFFNFFTDTVNYTINGRSSKRPIRDFAPNIVFWQGLTNLSFKNDTPSVPDAIQYKKGGLWVHDWIRATGIHKETGINIDLPFSNAYQFNKEGKINTWIQYADMAALNEIGKSKQTIENGTVYINHPYIVTVRKLVNAYCAKDIETMTSFYTPKAIFWKSDGKVNEFINLEEKMKENKQTFASHDKIKFTQVGYPDCIHYSKDDTYVVYSWWELSFTTNEGKKKSNIPVMVSHDFNKEGKIIREFLYLSGSHLK